MGALKTAAKEGSAASSVGDVYQHVCHRRKSDLDVEADATTGLPLLCKRLANSVCKNAYDPDHYFRVQVYHAASERSSIAAGYDRRHRSV